VQTWKKVIRVISHELNNSLAPIASMAHSGSRTAARGQHDKLPKRVRRHRGPRPPPRRLHPRLRALREAAGTAHRRRAWPGCVERLRRRRPVRIARRGAPEQMAQFDARRWSRRCSTC
jgi:hypothetical protein